MTSGWTEEASSTYRRLAAVAVPDRAEQIATLLAALPFGASDPFEAVELGCGAGELSHALLEAYPRSRVLALDGSEQMRQAAAPW